MDSRQQPEYAEQQIELGGITVTAPAVAFSEADWEGMALERLAEPLGWQPLAGQDIAPGTGERDSWDELLIRPRLLAALQRLNPTVPAQYLQQALAEIASPKSNDAITENHRLHNCLVDGYRLSYIDSDGNEAEPHHPAAQPRTRTRTTGSPSTRSPWCRATTSAASTSCSTATACR